MANPVEFKMKGLDKLVKRFTDKDPETLFRSMKRNLGVGMVSFIGRLQAERLSGRPGLRALTGNFRRSFSSEVRGGSLDTLEARAGTPVFWAGVHETGMTIVAKNPSGLLTFPVRAAGAAASSKIVGFVRVASVTIPPRLQFFATFKRNLPQLEARLGLTLKEL